MEMWRFIVFWHGVCRLASAGWTAQIGMKNGSELRVGRDYPAPSSMLTCTQYTHTSLNTCSQYYITCPGTLHPMHPACPALLDTDSDSVGGLDGGIGKLSTNCIFLSSTAK